MPSVFNALLCSRFVYLFLSDSFSPPPFVGLNVAPFVRVCKILGISDDNVEFELYA